METLAGDTTIGHTLAYCEALEGLTGCLVPERAQVIRGIALELERLANHVGDLGALANDVGFLPTASYCGRLRGDMLNMTAAICGSRFGRGLVIPGGVAFDLDHKRLEALLAKLEATARDVKNAVDLLFASSSVLARFEETGTVSRNTARDIGLVGFAARASALPDDIRQDFPSGIYRTFKMPVIVERCGDVRARAAVRRHEISQSVEFIQTLGKNLPTGATHVHCDTQLPANQLVMTLVEGWRGEICHILQTDAQGRFAWYKVVDPSFHNWMGLAMALRNQPISDFPLCNKSFNLSYCGHDL